jgi:ubiquinone/menaquinone biosynthesis C-methylase UbiE
VDRLGDVARFYAEAYDEDVRLTRSPHGRLEFARTRELLERVLPAPPARVLDVGGGTGIHARGSPRRASRSRCWT